MILTTVDSDVVILSSSMLCYSLIRQILGDDHLGAGGPPGGGIRWLPAPARGRGLVRFIRVNHSGRLDTGDHTLFAGEVVAAHISNPPVAKVENFAGEFVVATQVSNIYSLTPLSKARAVTLGLFRQIPKQACIDNVFRCHT